MKLVVERGRTVPFEDLPPASLALDGYVQGPGIDLAWRRFSFDHHDRCLRLVTRATCQQVLDALLVGFQPDDLTVYVNDVDGDTALSLWLLRNPARAVEARIRLMVESVGGIDAHGPAYPPLDRGVADAFFAVAMRAEQRARVEGSYATCDLAALLEESVAGIEAWVSGGMPVHPPPPPLAYSVLQVGTGGWVMVVAEGNVFGTLYAEGITRAIWCRPLEAGTWAYTVARRSDLVAGFPVGPPSQKDTILGRLRAAEPGWGGGSSIGGSPRNADGSSSRLAPDEVFRLVEELLGSR